MIVKTIMYRASFTLLLLCFSWVAHAGNNVFAIGNYLDSGSGESLSALQSVNGDIVDAEGNKVILWGVNIAASAAFQEKKHVDRIAADLAGYGFNAVRFHHIDTAYEPGGIFSRNGAKKNDLDRTRTGIMSKKQLDRLDYLIYALKKQGIYTNINLMSGRKFTLADGVKQADKLRKYSVQAGKPASMFDAHLIQLQKDFARELLEHVNPYTKMAYKDDPAIAMLELANETSLFRYWFNSRLDAGLLAKKKLPSYYAGQLDTLWDEWLGDNKARLGIDRFDRTAWKGRRLFDKQDLAAQIEFYHDIEKNYYLEMMDFLKNEIGTKALITGGGHYFSLANLKAQATADFTSPHFYWDPAKWTDGRWNKQKFTIKNHSIFDVGSGEFKTKPHPILDIGMSSVKDKPLLVTEWNQWFPNRYAYELPLMLGVYGSLQHWDGAMVFAYMRKPYKKQRWGMIDDFFEIYANPQKLVATSVAGLIIRGDYLKPAKTATVLSMPQNRVVENVLSAGSVRRTNKSWCVDSNTFLTQRVLFDFTAESFAPEKCSNTEQQPIISSDTDEIIWNKKEKYFAISAPRIRGVVGRFNSSSNRYVNDFDLTAKGHGAVILMSLDSKPIESSEQLLLSCLSEVSNTKADFDASYKQWGKGPVVLADVSATINLPENNRYQKLELDHAGNSVGTPAEASKRIACSNGTPWILLNRTKQ